jgi:hypothetical protein
MAAMIPRPGRSKAFLSEASPLWMTYTSALSDLAEDDEDAPTASVHPEALSVDGCWLISLAFEGRQPAT